MRHRVAVSVDSGCCVLSQAHGTLAAVRHFMKKARNPQWRDNAKALVQGVEKQVAKVRAGSLAHGSAVARRTR